MSHLVPASRVASLALLLASVAAAQTPLVHSIGDHPGELFGAAVAIGDDMDGDGIADVIVGAPGEGAAPGYVRVLSGADGRLIHRIEAPPAPASPDAFGFAVAAAGDGDGDGARDILVGNPGSSATPGSHAQVFSSASGAYVGTLSLPAGDSWSGYGHAVAGPGDLDGDGYPDLAVGAPSLSGEQAGRVRLFTHTGAFLLELRGEAAGDGFGFAIAPAGDVDLDGTPDLVVGVPGAGAVRVMSGDGSGVIAEATSFAPSFGSVVSDAGDVDGDGTRDFAAGLPALSRVDVLSGVDGSELRHFQELPSEFGASVAPLGDVDGDDVPDLLVGAPADDTVALVDAGSAFAISGSTGRWLFEFAGQAAGGRLGAAVATGDIDGDGRLEVLGGAPLASAGAGSTGLWSGLLPGSLVSYGIGCPGSFLITPRLEMFGDPLPGGALTISLTRALGGAPAILALGGGAGVAPLKNGCILWMDPLLLALPFVIDGNSPGAGTKVFIGHLPHDTPLGLVIAAQVLIADSGTDGGIATTSAFLVTVQ